MTDPERRYQEPSETGEFDPLWFTERIQNHGYSGAMGMRYHSHGEDWCELTLDWQQELAGDAKTNILASGPIIGLLDMAAGVAIWKKINRFEPIVTIDLRVDYMRSSPPGERLHARCTCFRSTRSIQFIRGVAHNGDPADPVAVAAGTFMRLGQGSAR